MLYKLWDFVSYIFNFLKPTPPLIKDNEDLELELKQFVDNYEKPPKYEFIFERY